MHLGYLPLQDHREISDDSKLPIERRLVRYAVRITDAGLGRFKTTDRKGRASEGDVLCSTLWWPDEEESPAQKAAKSGGSTITRAQAKKLQSATRTVKRPLAGWAYAWPCITSEDEETEGTGGAGRDGCTPSERGVDITDATQVGLDFSNTGTGAAGTGNVGSTRTRGPGTRAGSGAGGSTTTGEQPVTIKLRPVRKDDWEQDDRFPVTIGERAGVVFVLPYQK